MASPPPRARTTMAITASADAVYQAFVEPAWLTRFWLAKASAPLEIGTAVQWDFLVPGATEQTTAVRLDPGVAIAWRWSDGSSVTIELASIDGETAVTLVNADFPGEHDAQVEAALNAIEGFAIVLCDLKTLLETGRSAGLVRAKAKLIERRG